jgi:hypothetical protein
MKIDNVLNIKYYGDTLIFKCDLITPIRGEFVTCKPMHINGKLVAEQN